MTNTEKKIFDDVEAKYNASKSELDKRFKDFNDYEDMYWGYIDPKKNAWKSSVNDPEIFEKVERVVSHLFAGLPRGRVVPFDYKSDPRNAAVHDELFRYQWRKPGQNMQSKMRKIGLSMALFGNGFGKLEWRYEVRGGVVIWDDPYFSDLYIYDCFPDPSATSIEDCEYFILNDYTTIAQLKAQNQGEVKRYINLGELEEAVKNKKEDAQQENWRHRVEDITGINEGVVKGRILVRRMFTRERWITVAPDFKVVIEDRENPYEHKDLPIHSLPNYEYPNQLYARGEADPVASLQRGLNDVVNQRLDNVRMILNPVMKTKANARYAHTWKFQPGYKWVMDDLNEVDQFQIADVTGNTFAGTVAYFKDAISKATGQHDIITRNTRNATATRDKLAAGEQNARLKAKEANVDSFVQRLVTQWVQLNQQFVKMARVVRITGNEELKEMSNQFIQKDELGEYPTPEIYGGEEVEKFKISRDGSYGSLVVTPDDLVGAYDFQVETGSMTSIDPTEDFDNMMTALTLVQNAAPALQSVGTNVKMQPLIEKMLHKLGIKNTEEIFENIPQQPMAPEMAGGETMQPPTF